MIKSRFSLKTFSIIAIVAYLSCFAITPAMAGFVTTAQTLDGPKARLISLVERQDVKDSIVSMGIDPAEASRRVMAMTDAEAASAMNKLDTLPAGGDVVGMVIGGAIVVLVVLLITDLVGITDVFGFSHHGK